MITAKELRTGNLVLNDYKEVNVVTTIDEFGSIKIRYPSFKSYYTYFGKLHPIPITEEWLLHFGFKKEKIRLRSSAIFFRIDCGLFTLSLAIYYDKDCYMVSLENSLRVMFLRQIKYVHQLQNLYFALTGEELEINEN